MDKIRIGICTENRKDAEILMKKLVGNDVFDTNSKSSDWYLNVETDLMHISWIKPNNEGGKMYRLSHVFVDDEIKETEWFKNLFRSVLTGTRSVIKV